MSKRKRQRVRDIPGRRPPRRRRRKARTALFNGELKFLDLTIVDAGVSATGAITDSVNLIPQGVDESERVGRKCTLRSIGWRFDYSLAAQADVADLSNGDVLRVLLYLDKQANGATAVVATAAGILETADYRAFNNLANTSRFRTLMDRTYSINRQVAMTDGASTGSSPQIVMHDSFFMKVNIPLEFDLAAGAITEIRSNNVGVLLISRNAVVDFNSVMRIRFSDN